MLKSRTMSLIWSRQMYRWHQQRQTRLSSVAFCQLPYHAVDSINQGRQQGKRDAECRTRPTLRHDFPSLRALRCDAAYAGCDPRVGMKLFLLPAGAYRELIIPNYLESMYLAKLPKSLHPPNNIMRELKMKLRGHGRPTAVQELTRARITDTIPPYARALTGIGLFRNSRADFAVRGSDSNCLGSRRRSTFNTI